MDPQVTWDNLLAALEAGDLDGAANAADDLLDWLDNDGFAPQVVPGRTLPAAWNRAVAYTGCRQILLSDPHELVL